MLGIEGTTVNFPVWRADIRVYRTPSTRARDSMYSLQTVLAMMQIHQAYLFTGNASSQYPVGEFASLHQILGHYVALTPDLMIQRCGRAGYQDALTQEVLQVADGYVMFHEKVLQSAMNLCARIDTPK